MATEEVPRDLAREGARGFLWQGGSFAAGKLVVLATIVVLARLLSPQEYGLVALALVLMSYAETIADAGVAQALVYLPRTADMARSALVVSVVIGGLLACAAVLVAPILAALIGVPDVAGLMRILAVSLFATSLAAVPEALLRRDLLFRRLTAAPVVKAVAMGTVTLSLAFAGYGAASLAIGTSAGSVAYAAACWILLPGPRPWQVWRATRDGLRANVTFGAPTAGGTLLARLIFDVDYIIVGLLLGTQALGYYTLAFRLPEMVIINVFFILSTVMFPLYTHVSHDRTRLAEGYLTSVRLQSLYGITAGVGLAVIAPVLVPVLFGPQWTAAVVPLVFLALYAAARSLGAGANDVYKALGRPGISIQISLVRLAILVPALVVATRWGIVGVACAQMIVAIVFAGGMQAVAARVVRLRPVRLLRAVGPGVACGAAVAVVGLGTFAEPVLGQLATMVLVVLLGVVVAYAVLRVGFSSLHRELAALIRRRP